MRRSGNEPGERVVLDTSAYSRLRTGDKRVLGLLADADEVALTTVSLGELEAGFRLGSRYAENRRVLDDFLSESFVTVLETTRPVAHRYGLLFAELKRAGNPLTTNDIWIAAATLHAGGHLITFDRDFAKVPGLVHTLLD